MVSSGQDPDDMPDSILRLELTASSVRLVPAAAIDSDRPSVKNTIPVKEYLLATEAVLSRLSEERQKRFTPYEEIYDLGPARAGYEPLG